MKYILLAMQLNVVRQYIRVYLAHLFGAFIWRVHLARAYTSLSAGYLAYELGQGHKRHHAKDIYICPRLT